MSWWDPNNFSNFASQAIKTAQKSIDKVLDIKEGDEDDGASANLSSSSSHILDASSKSTPSSKTQDLQSDSADNSFWNAYLGAESLMGFTSLPSTSTPVTKPTARASTPSTGSRLGTGVPFKHTSSQLKTSATSAFSVRPKRVESTLSKSQVQYESPVEVPERTEGKLTKSIPHEREGSQESLDQHEVIRIKFESAKEERPVEKTESQFKRSLDDVEQMVKSKSSEEEQITKAPEVNLGASLLPGQEELPAKDKTEPTSTESGKRSQPLKLGLKLSKKKEEEAQKKVADQKAKEEASLIAMQVEDLLLDDKSEPTECVVSSNINKDAGKEVQQDQSIPTSALSLVPPEEPTEAPEVSGDGSGWEDEMVDVDELVSEEEPSPEKGDDPGISTNSSDELNRAETGGSGDADGQEPQLKLEEKDKDDADGESAGEAPAEMDQEQEKQQTEEQPVLDSLEPKECAISVETASEECAPILEANTAVEETVDEPDLNVGNVEGNKGEEERNKKIDAENVEQEVESGSLDKLQISMDSSGTAEETTDELSESSRTLTADDFKSASQVSQEEAKLQDSEIGEKPQADAIIVSTTGGAEDRQVVAESSEAIAEGKKEGSAFLSSSSYVKTMLEEAMVESVKDTDSHSSSTSEKSSEMVRIESGMNSGHTSGDEIDTTTSSDIEIISTPTPNGEYRQDRPFDLSPLRQALSRTVRRSPPGHKRSDSSSSGQSTWSKNGDDVLSPDGGMHHEKDVVEEETQEEETESSQTAEEKPESSQQGTVKQDLETASDPLEKDKLLKETDQFYPEKAALQQRFHQQPHQHSSLNNLQTIMEIFEPHETSWLRQEAQEADLLPSGSRCSLDKASVGVLHEDFGSNLDVSEMQQKLADMAEVLDAREKKLVELSRENIDLHEANAIVKNQLQQSEEAREAEMEDLNTVTEEFTTRLSDFENRIQMAARERDTLRRQLQDAQSELVKKSSNSSGLERMLKEKDQQISELLDEGEKLSKQQLQSNNIIKKLRAKEKDNDALVKSQKQKLEQQKEELDHLHKVFDAKEEVEKKQIEAINQQNICIKKQEIEMNKLKSELEDVQEKARGLQAALDNSYKEMAELHKANAAAASETQVARLSVEMQAKQELQMAMDRQLLVHKQETEALITQIEDLQMSLTRLEREHGRREDVLRQEISDLQQRLQEAEERNQDLTESVSVATRPLLRQIENLQTTYAAQASSYEKVEHNLTERLAEAQTLLAEATEKERASGEQMMEARIRLTSFETQMSALRQDKSRLLAQLEVEKTKCILLEDTKNSETAKLEAIKDTNETAISGLKKDKILLENQLEMEKMRVEAEKKKLVIVQEQLRDKELQLQRPSTTPSPHSFSREGSITGDPVTPLSISQEDVFEKTLMLTSANGSKANLYESLRQSGAATLIESLQAQLKMKEGEIAQLQAEIAELEHTRESMARELVNLSTKNEDLLEQLTEYPEIKLAHKDLDSRYQALLQMYGEKVEEADELNMDLQDVKDMYKAQIEELLKRR